MVSRDDHVFSLFSEKCLSASERHCAWSEPLCMHRGPDTKFRQIDVLLLIIQKRYHTKNTLALACNSKNILQNDQHILRQLH